MSRHSPPRGDKRGGYNRDRGEAGFFQFDAVEHTARTTRPSIADSSNNEIRAVAQRGHRFRRDAVAGGLFAL